MVKRILSTLVCIPLLAASMADAAAQDDGAPMSAASTPVLTDSGTGGNAPPQASNPPAPAITPIQLMDAAIKKQQAAEQSISALQAIVSGKTAQIVVLRQQLDQAEQEKSSLQGQLMSAQVDQAMMQKSVLEIAALRKQLGQATADKLRLQAQASSLNPAVSQAAACDRSLVAKINMQQATIVDLTRQLQQARASSALASRAAVAATAASSPEASDPVAVKIRQMEQVVTPGTIQSSPVQGAIDHTPVHRFHIGDTVSVDARTDTVDSPMTRIKTGQIQAGSKVSVISAPSGAPGWYLVVLPSRTTAWIFLR